MVGVSYLLTTANLSGHISERIKSIVALTSSSVFPAKNSIMPPLTRACKSFSAPLTSYLLILFPLFPLLLNNPAFRRAAQQFWQQHKNRFSRTAPGVFHSTGHTKTPQHTYPPPRLCQLLLLNRH